MRAPYSHNVIHEKIMFMDSGAHCTPLQGPLCICPLGGRKKKYIPLYASGRRQTVRAPYLHSVIYEKILLWILAPIVPRYGGHCVFVHWGTSKKYISPCRPLTDTKLCGRLTRTVSSTKKLYLWILAPIVPRYNGPLCICPLGGPQNKYIPL